MIAAGRFEHIGHASIRVEGTTAWGVWLRVDQWPTALGRHPHLRCGVLYHVANRTLSFHGIARDAVQFLLHSFRIGRVLLSLSCLPFDRQVLELKLTVLRPVVPSHNVRLLSPVLAVPNLEVVLSHSLRCCLLQVTTIRQLELQVPPLQKFQSYEVWFSGMSCGPSGQPQQYLHPRQQVFPTRVFPRQSVVLLIPHLMPRVVLQGARNKSLPGVQCNFAAPIARVRDAQCTRAGHPVVPGSAGGPQWCPGLAPAGSEAHCTSQRCRLHRGPVCSSKGCGEVPSPGCVACARRIAIISPPATPPPPASTSRRHPNRSLVICRHRSCTQRAHPECNTRHCHFTLFQQ